MVSFVDQELAMANEKLQVPSGFGGIRKRKCGNDSEYLQASIKDLASLETMLVFFHLPAPF